EAVSRADLPPDAVDHVVMGHVLQAGAGQITSRQAAGAAGVPQEGPAPTLNHLRLSSLTPVAHPHRPLPPGGIHTPPAAGMESMTNAPYVLPNVRWGARLGDAEVVDAMIHDGLWSTFTGQHMGESSDEVNAELAISREDQDAWAARSHQRAAEARESGRFAEEVVGVETERDEGIRADTTAASLAELPPAFAADGTITAGNASQLSDGAAAVTVMRRERADALGIAPLAEVVASGMSAERFAYLHTVPALAL